MTRAPKGTFDEEVRRLKGQLEAQPRSDAEVDEGRRRLLDEVGRKRALHPGWLAGPAIAVAALLAAILLVRRDGPSQPRVRITERAECVDRARDRISVTAGCASAAEISVDDDRLSVAPGTELELRARGVALAKGRTRFSIARRDSLGDRFEVAVSHGVIVVIGTRFAVEQRAGGGRVEVQEGTIEFRWSNGAAPERVGAGGALSWPKTPPQPAPPPPATETATATKTHAKARPASPPPRRRPMRRRKRDAPSIEALMKRLLRLRSQRRYSEAIALLREGSHRDDFTPVQRERLSFELGNLLRQSGRLEQACRHLKRHLRRFPSTPRKEEIEAEIARCPTDAP